MWASLSWMRVRCCVSRGRGARTSGRTASWSPGRGSRHGRSLRGGRRRGAQPAHREPRGVQHGQAAAALHQLRRSSARLPRLTRLGSAAPFGSGKFYRARSRLYRSQILQVRMRLKALAEICTIAFFCIALKSHFSLRNARMFSTIAKNIFRICYKS